MTKNNSNIMSFKLGIDVDKQTRIAIVINNFQPYH